METAAMVDSGATALFLGKEFVERNHILTFPLRQPIDVFNIDGTPNQAGRIERFARLGLAVDGQESWTDFLITDLGGEDIILGLPWLRTVNLKIDWEGGRLEVKKRNSPRVTVEDVPEEEEQQIGGTTEGERIMESVAGEPEEGTWKHEELRPDVPLGPEPEDAPLRVRIWAN